ncbi:MAG: hypothetical protein Q8K60_00185 [Parachlamydiaceae bacterium]|nr:hypothetical protein [Parachlamydiaceae bacterium]
MKKLFSVLILSFFLKCGDVHAEIEKITIRWNPITGREMVVPGIIKSLTAIPAVSNVQADGASGSASMSWNPRSPFAYEPFKFAAGAAGIRFREMRLRIKGTIKTEEAYYYLLSSIDQSRFRIIGPAQTDPNRYIVTNNIETHHLSKLMANKLNQAADLQQEVVIEGPLFLPNSFPRTIILEQFLVPKEKNNHF